MKFRPGHNSRLTIDFYLAHIATHIRCMSRSRICFGSFVNNAFKHNTMHNISKMKNYIDHFISNRMGILHGLSARTVTTINLDTKSRNCMLLLESFNDSALRMHMTFPTIFDISVFPSTFRQF